MDEELKATEKVINLKVKAYDVLNRELEKLIEAAGGLELDPNELKVLLSVIGCFWIKFDVINFQVKSLEKQLADIEIETKEAQNFWLRLQKHVVNLSEKRSLQQNKLSLTSKRMFQMKYSSIIEFKFLHSQNCW